MTKFLCCCGGGLCFALLTGALMLGGGTAIVSEASAVVAEKSAGCTGTGCAKPGCDKHASTGAPCATMSGIDMDIELTAIERKVVSYLADLIEDGQAPAISSEKLARETGLNPATVEELDSGRLRSGVMVELARRNFDMSILGGNCSKYNACSVDHNLMNATGDELERYKAEVAMDGARFSDRVAPDFTLPSTKGGLVSLSEYRGKNVAVVFLSAHCYHSLDTLPILAELKAKYGDRNLAILPVFVNSGDVEDVASRAWELDVEYPLIVAEGKEVVEAYESRMVPSTFLIDEQGNLTRRLVGFKDSATLTRALGELLGS